MTINKHDTLERSLLLITPDDYKILYNDWPYGVDVNIIHLVVWVKFGLEEDPTTGEITDATRKQIDRFVGKTFMARMPAANVLWFKNWKSLKSVHSLEHFHVMLKGPDQAFVDEITHGDIPLIDQV
jgi:hypothetical protein